MTVAGILLFSAVCVAIGAFVLPRFTDSRSSEAAKSPSAAAPEAKAPAKSALELAMEAADREQEKAEMAAGVGEYRGVSVPEKLDSYVVAVPDDAKPSYETGKSLGRPMEEPVVPQLPTGVGAIEVSKAIDAEIMKKLEEAKIPTSPLADDAEFLRRVYLDLTGRIPTCEQTVNFLKNRDPYKRTKLIDELLADERFGLHTASIWTELLVKRDFDNNKNLKTEAFHTWLAEQFNKNEPWNKIVETMITAEGKETENPATFFLLANQDNNQPSPSKLTGATGNLFMGVQIQCAECHVHPFTSKWKPTDFWGMAAFFGHTKFDREGADKKGKGGIATVVEKESGEKPKENKKNKDKSPAILAGASINIPDPTNPKKTLAVAKAKYFEREEPKLAEKGPYRPAIATWVTSEKNKYFAPAMVNRTWFQFFARGFVNPIDDMKVENAATHPAALKLLANEFAKSGYDAKFLVKVICNTQAYQRTSRPTGDNGADEALYSHQLVKVIGAEELLDSLAVATSHKEKETMAKEKGKGKGDKGPAGTKGFFDVREYDDDTREYAFGIPHVLRLMNSGLTNSANNAAASIAKGQSNRAKIIDDIYLTALSRHPSEEETKRMLAFVVKQGDAKGYGNVFWALLNSAEFVCNR